MKICIALLYLCIVVLANEEKMRVDQDILVFSFSHGKETLPIGLQEALVEQKIINMTINYGVRWNNKIGEQYPNNGIRTHLKMAEPHLSLKLKHLLTGAFMISSSQLHSVLLSPQQLYISDPNDKFCTNHLEEIVRNMLPCSSYSGLIQLIKLDQLLTAGYVGMKFQWESQSWSLHLYLKLTKKLENIKNIKVLSPCAYYDQIQMLDSKNEVISLNQVVSHRLKEFKQSPSRKVETSVRKRVVGQWYDQRKLLVIEIVGRFLDNQTVIINENFPKGIHFQSLTVQPHNIAASYSCSNGINSQKCQIHFKTLSIIQHYTLIIQIQTFLKNFDQYQSIHGGGEEITRIPVRILGKKRRDILPPPISIRIPQPDFSIPFQVMTFTLAAAGYLWVAIWRAYFQSHS